ncbi:MAG: hypothetical protein ACOX6D_00920 [Thermoguttaceae bacterium]|jgi:hypothetical protein
MRKPHLPPLDTKVGSDGKKFLRMEHVHPKMGEIVGKTLTVGKEQSLWWRRMVKGYLSGLSLPAQRPIKLP